VTMATILTIVEGSPGFSQPVFQREYPGWSFEPGLLPGSSKRLHEGRRGRIHSGRWIMEAPEVAAVKSNFLPGCLPLKFHRRPRLVRQAETK
jgi:hypothetical protein